MKAKKSLILFLVTCLCLTLSLSLGVAAEDGAASDNIITRMGTFNFVSLIVLAVVLVAVAILCIVKREKLGVALRAYKAELKNITWFPWKSVWRNTVLVIVVVVAVALVIGLLDIAFFEAQYLLTGQGFRFFGGN
ncbi:MAG: preprotein translocase subunit SecE [Clostridia bacterium]|nr:preprotein translocase subunit SecE [Clostridia bacterium]MBQ9098069.1 preprotein translocase subunit SecE [Clostridia bacterium]